MTTAAPAADTAPTDTAPASRQEAGTRGRLSIADRVVERTAAAAVAEVDSAAGARRTVLGMSLGSSDEDTAARVDAVVRGDVTDVRVTLSVQWPRSIRDVTATVREHIVATVQRTTGYTVRQVDIHVVTMITDSSDVGRVV